MNLLGQVDSDYSIHHVEKILFHDNTDMIRKKNVFFRWILRYFTKKQKIRYSHPHPQHS